jgi:predicted PurR-regulated permease PerM
MKIRTQFYLSIILFGILIVAISASAIVTSQYVNQEVNQQEKVNNIIQGANDLSYIANDYIIYRSSQELALWQSSFSDFSSNAANLKGRTPAQTALIRNIQANVPQLQDVFNSVVSGFVNSPQNSAGTAGNSLLQESWSRMAVQTQQLVSESSSLSQLLTQQVNQAERMNLIIIIVFICLFALYFLINYLMIEMRTLKSLGVCLSNGRLAAS